MKTRNTTASRRSRVVRSQSQDPMRKIINYQMNTTSRDTPTCVDLSTEKVSEELRYAGSEFGEDLYEATDDQCSKVASGNRSALRRAVWHGTDHAIENRCGEARRFASWKNDTG